MNHEPIVLGSRLVDAVATAIDEGDLAAVAVLAHAADEIAAAGLLQWVVGGTEPAGVLP